MPLTDTAIRNAKPREKAACPPLQRRALYLEVAPPGASGASCLSALAQVNASVIVVL